ncbi:MAG TPA: penicillin-binding transpeptidase domain-containing protein [Terriglobales bacterium]|nr:penicillin-binding transpeptidase domain-containing protein [Terriglobales bacterium]
MTIALVLWLLSDLAGAATTGQAADATGKTKSGSTQARSGSKKATTRKTATRKKRRYRRYERFYTSSYADDVTAGDVTEGEDPVVREAALDALGRMNGTVVVIDSFTGRILTMVNQKLALSQGAQPCSTFKVAVALAALNDGVVTRDEEIVLGFTRRRRYVPRRPITMNLTKATAESNNPYFQVLGRRLGFERVSRYAHEFGLGELAGWGIEGEHPGVFPETEPKAGVGLMCSHGEGIQMTPLQLGAFMAAVANGGTLYYLQHPSTAQELASFQPRIKRELNIGSLIPEVSEGMVGAVEYGSARSLRYSFWEETVAGKTGTCSHNGTRFGWFASWTPTERGPLVTVVFLQGGRPTFGPRAAEITGRFYRNLYDRNYFAARATAQSQTASEQQQPGGSGTSH